MNNQLASKYWTYFLFLQILFVQIVAKFPVFIETYYSTKLYTVLSQIMRFLLGWLPFSLGDLFYILLVLSVIRFLYIIIREKFSDVRNYFFALGKYSSIFYFLFHLNWGLNYYRVPLNTQLNISTTSYTSEQLISFTQQYIKDINTLHVSIVNTPQEKIEVPYSQNEIHHIVQNGYDSIAKKHDFLKIHNHSLKKSLLSSPLTYMGFAGYLNPFTGEAQVNSKIPLVTLPFTVCHEIAHQVGYAAENEANFIGYLASTHNTDLYVQYAGKLTALRYLLSEIYRRDPILFNNLKDDLNMGIRKNLQDISSFWKSYENPFEIIFKTGYSSYLKANQQKSGIESYNYMVNLLLNYKE